MSVSLPGNVSVAYFSMEVGLKATMPTYSGGLGVLAGDTLKSAADLSAPMVAVTMLYHKGYFEQAIDADGNQVALPVSWDPTQELTLLPQKIELTIEGRRVIVQAWLHELKGVNDHILPILFLDTNLAENAAQDKALSYQLYGGDLYHRLCQEIVLGIGGMKILDAVGYSNLETYHMNEGHAAFLTLNLLTKHNWQDSEVRKRCTFTTHTPVPAGHDAFPYEMAYKVMEPYLPWHIKDLAGQDILNMTILALNMSRFANGVAQKHGEVSRNMFPDFEIDAITNGVHSVTWTAPAFQDIFDTYIPEWRNEPESLAKAQIIPINEIVEAHRIEKQRLFDYIKKNTGEELDPNILTIGFARRAATYKRGNLIFSDLERLIKIAGGKVQFVFAGKAHPKDEPGKAVIKEINLLAKKLTAAGSLTVVFLPNYNMVTGGLLTAGVDVWLNNPIRPREASGTSGMKSTHNGVPNFSVLDGWWIEGWQENVTGWAIGPEAKETNLVENNNEEDVNDFYQKLENVVIPTYYNNPEQWHSIMKNTIAKNANFFNTHRMVKEYMAKAYAIHKVTA